MVEVFKTNINKAEDADSIKKNVLEQFPLCKINFDLEDCDKILRIEGSVDAKNIIDILQNHNFYCEILE